jgi:beta-lactam-binding protein with PASTA domain
MTRVPCSTANSMVDVLDVVGQTYNQAMSTLQAQGLTVTSTGVSDCGADETTTS